MNKSIEEMKTELLEAGYSVGVYRDYVSTPHTTPQLLSFEWAGSLTSRDYVEKAYAHLEHEREYAAMKALLEEVSEEPYNNSQAELRFKIIDFLKTL